MAKANEEKQKVSEAQGSESNKPTTLPEVMGKITEDVMLALQGTNPVEKQRAIAQGLREMRIWYDAQPVDGRKEAARVSRKSLENFKLIAEQFFQEMMTLSAQDAQ